MLYKLFKRIYADRILKEMHAIFGWHKLIEATTDYGDEGKAGVGMSWEEFIKSFKGK